MQTINNLPGKGLSSETMQGGFHVDTIEHPNPGFYIMEEWREISGYEGVYQVSSFGNLRSKNRECKIDPIRRSKKHKRTVKGRLLTPMLKNRGYYTINLCRNGNAIMFNIHRLVALVFITNPENKPCVNHKDGNKLNNHFENLEWVTYSENIKHAYDNGLIKKKYYSGGLNTFQVKVIRKTKGLTHLDLAEIFNVSQSCIYKIITYRTWKHI